jgi:hypothetical protein
MGVALGERSTEPEVLEYGLEHTTVVERGTRKQLAA